MSTLLSKLDILYVDHLAVTTPVFENTLADYLSLAGSRLLKGPAANPDQKVIYAFVQLQNGMVLEVLSKETGVDSPISTHLEQGGGPYHICYAVADIDIAIERAVGEGAKVLVKPIADVAFDGRRVTFLFHQTHGVFELVEAYPSNGRYTSSTKQPENIGIIKKSKQSGIDKVEKENLEERLYAVFSKVFPKSPHDEIITASINGTEGWDSLSHLRLMMELEMEYSINIPTERIATLVSYNDIYNFLMESVGE